MPSLGRKYRAPMSVIHRGDLHRILLKAATKFGCRIFTAQTVTAVDSTFLPRVKAERGSTGETVWFGGDVVIAADSIKSTIRR